jgi:hypothetical protein
MTIFCTKKGNIYLLTRKALAQQGQTKNQRYFKLYLHWRNQAR